jgi:UDP-N-acetylglucosamine:LPS N-acetylglucosamine transferase
MRKFSGEGPVLVLSAASGAGHIRAAEALVSAFTAQKVAAVRCNNLPTLACKIDGILGDQERFRKMQENARRIGRSHAASDVVSIVLG